jgi:hypothetical protein
MHKLQHRKMQQQGNNSLSKAKSTTKDLSNSEGQKISIIESRKIIVRIINELKRIHKIL